MEIKEVNLLQHRDKYKIFKTKLLNFKSNFKEYQVHQLLHLTPQLLVEKIKNLNVLDRKYNKLNTNYSKYQNWKDRFSN